MFILIRSLCFNIYFYVWTGLVTIFAMPFLFMPPLTTSIISRVWALGAMWGLKHIAGVSYQVIGKEHLPAHGPYIIASKHQSTFDVIVFLLLLNKPVYILKKELLKLPLYGLYLMRMGMIAIDRAGGSKTLRQLVVKTKQALAMNRSVIIFPEGTRINPGQSVEYQPGVAAFYALNSVPIIPVALNTGIFWQKGAFIKQPGTAIFQFLPPLSTGLTRDEFMQQLKQQIDTTSETLSADNPK